MRRRLSVFMPIVPEASLGHSPIPGATHSCIARLEKARSSRELRRRTAAVVLALASLYLAFGFYRIPSGSMVPLLKPGDHVVVNRLAYGVHLPHTRSGFLYRAPARGEVITFYAPFVNPHLFEPGPEFVKRVVATSGDTVEMRGGVLLVNSLAQPDRFVSERGADATSDADFVTMRWQRNFLLHATDSANYHPTRDTWGPLIVPRDSYFVLGDNRTESADSRYWGFVPKKLITGTPLLVWRNGRISGL